MCVFHPSRLALWLTISLPCWVAPSYAALGDFPAINTIQATSTFNHGFNQAQTNAQLVLFLVNSNTTTGFTVTFTFANKGKFKAGTAEFNITGLVLDDYGGTLGTGLTVPVNEVITLDGAGVWVWSPGNTPTTETVNYLVEIKGSWADHSTALSGFYYESISAVIAVGI